MLIPFIFFRTPFRMISFRLPWLHSLLHLLVIKCLLIFDLSSVTFLHFWLFFYAILLRSSTFNCFIFSSSSHHFVGILPIHSYCSISLSSFLLFVPISDCHLFLLAYDFQFAAHHMLLYDTVLLFTTGWIDATLLFLGRSPLAGRAPGTRSLSRRSIWDGNARVRSTGAECTPFRFRLILVESYWGHDDTFHF